MLCVKDAAQASKVFTMHNTLCNVPNMPKAIEPKAQTFISIDDAAAELDVTRRFLESRIADGELRVFKPSARLVRIKRTDLENWIERFTKNSAAVS
jgi:excisionase family DNA binding protein